MSIPVFVLQLDGIGNQRDKLGIGRFSLARAHSIAEQFIQGIQLSSVPRHLNGMADSALHSAGGCLVFLRHCRIEYFRDGV